MLSLLIIQPNQHAGAAAMDDGEAVRLPLLRLATDASLVRQCGFRRM
ncbi:MAG: hypothetical protein JWO49_2579 [Arthrobacter sp.]|nr:hypothetical protein [Arthrobacter sp.]